MINSTVDSFFIKSFFDCIGKIIEDKFIKNCFLELICLLLVFVVFSAKSIRYKNMEVIDTVRTYRYLAENRRKHSKKHKYDK